VTRVLVTGGAGAIGTAVVRRMLREGDWSVRVSDQRDAEHCVVERVVDLGQRVRQLVEVRDPADDRREVDDV